MKKLILVLICISLFTMNVEARAGGGSSSSGSSSSSYHSSSYSRSGRPSIKNNIIGFLEFIILSSIIPIMINYRLIMAMFYSKQKLKDYKTIKKRVKESYFIIQNAWTNNDMKLAKEYMSHTLYDSFKLKLIWMDEKKNRNILKNIKLIYTFPISVSDKYVWFIIKGRMVDYIIDTDTNEITDGSSYSNNFIEYWKYIYDDNNNLVLDEILQNEDLDKIILTDNK